MQLINTQVQKQEQLQVLSQKQLQSLKILSLSRPDLEKMIEEEVEANPLLEINQTMIHDDIDFDLILNYVEKTKNLTDILLEQLHLYPKHINIELGEFIIDCLDHNGYLLCSLDELEKIFNVDTKEIEDIIQVIQTFEPIGCACRSLNECLITQLLHTDSPYAQLAIEICNYYFQELADNKIDSIIKATHVSKEDIKNAIFLIREMNPRPGSEYDNESLYISCDMEIIRDSMGIIIKDLFEGYDLKVVDIYDCVDDNYVHQYISKQKTKARNFIENLHKRRKTLLELTTFITEYQKEFFIEGLPIKALTMKQAADYLSLSESTISRTVKDKYLLFENNVYAYKYFFSQKLETGESSDNVLIKIKQYIAEENKKKPLSDQQICDLLNRDGIKIARRTVSKYREKVNIRSALKRKEI